MSLEARDLTLANDRNPVVVELSARVETGSITALVGANTSGKSTLLRGLARLLKPAGGTVLLDGRAITRLGTKQIARRMAVLPQSGHSPRASPCASWPPTGATPTRDCCAVVP